MNAYKQSLYCGIARIMANLVMVGAIFLAMYQAGRWPGWSSEAVFCLVFFGITIPVWALNWYVMKYIRRHWPGCFSSTVELPGLGKQIVTWKVREQSGPAGPLADLERT